MKAFRWSKFKPFFWKIRVRLSLDKSLQNKLNYYNKHIPEVNGLMMKLNSISFGIFRGSSELPALLLNRLFYGHETWHIIGTHQRNKLKKCWFFSIMAHIFLLTSSEIQNVPQFLQKYLSSFKLTKRATKKIISFCFDFSEIPFNYNKHIQRLFSHYFYKSTNKALTLVKFFKTWNMNVFITSKVWDIISESNTPCSRNILAYILAQIKETKWCKKFFHNSGFLCWRH